MKNVRGIRPGHVNTQAETTRTTLNPDDLPRTGPCSASRKPALVCRRLYTGTSNH
jgi:hypothetical protein